MNDYTQSEMEEMRELAKAYFGSNSSAQTQARAKAFFNSMDSDGDGKVELSEFLSFMSRKGYKRTGNPGFFDKLKGDGNGGLDFWDVMTLYYIIKSGRPFCDCCGEFIPATYFSCVKCFKDGTSFDLCLRCYQSAAHCNHTHLGRPATFLDNYTLLQSKHPSQLQLDLVLLHSFSLINLFFTHACMERLFSLTMIF